MLRIYVLQINAEKYIKNLRNTTEAIKLRTHLYYIKINTQPFARKDLKSSTFCHNETGNTYSETWLHYRSDARRLRHRERATYKYNIIFI